MATLASFGLAPVAAVIKVIGFKESSVVNSDGIPYMELTLKAAVEVGCSTDPSIGRVEFDHLLCLPEHVNSDKWEGTKEEGLYIPGFVADFSKSHLEALYQPSTIQSWVRGQREENKKKNTNRIQEFLAAKRKSS